MTTTTTTPPPPITTTATVPRYQLLGGQGTNSNLNGIRSKCAGKTNCLDQLKQAEAMGLSCLNYMGNCFGEIIANFASFCIIVC
jgi:hypothetical protein